MTQESRSPQETTPGVDRRNFLKHALGAGLTLLTWNLSASTGRALEQASPSLVGTISESEELNRLFILNELDVEGNSVVIAGVLHNYDFFQENRDEIEEEVRRADLIISEYLYPELEDLAQPDFSSQTILESIERRKLSARPEINAFFVLLQQACAKYQKPIAKVNPQNDFTRYLVAPGLVGAGVGELVRSQTMNNLSHMIDTSGEGKLGLKKMSRRQIIQFGVASLFSGWSLASLKGKFQPLSAKSQGRQFETGWIRNRQEGVAGNMELSEFDYRDVMTARRIRELLKKAKNKDLRVLVVQGALHNGVRTYLERPDLLQLSETKYGLTPYYLASAVGSALGAGGDTKIRVFNPTTSEWRAASETELLEVVGPSSI